jgi:hypothetical protein
MTSNKPLGQFEKTEALEFVPPAEIYRLQKLELSLNRAILEADIQFGPEQFVAAFNRFYDEKLEVRNYGGIPLKGKQANLQILLSFLTPVHVVVEVGAAAVHCFEMERSWIEPDGFCVSTWRLDITGPVDSGRRNLGWTTGRRWKGDHVVFEEHTEQEGLHLVSPAPQPNEDL